MKKGVFVGIILAVTLLLSCSVYALISVAVDNDRDGFMLSRLQSSAYDSSVIGPVSHCPSEGFVLFREKRYDIPAKAFNANFQFLLNKVSDPSGSFKGSVKLSVLILDSQGNPTDKYVEKVITATKNINDQLESLNLDLSSSAGNYYAPFYQTRTAVLKIEIKRDKNCKTKLDSSIGYKDMTIQIDCNDNDAGIYPGKLEICGDNIDQDCNGLDQTCPPPNTHNICLDANNHPDAKQIILALSAPSEAKGELGTYNNGFPDASRVEICYNQIFGEQATGNSHDCTPSNTPTNRVLSLSASTNAFASANHDATYSNDVCFKNLICRGTTESCDSSQGEKLIVSISSANLLTNTSDYQTKICCKKNEVRLYSANWTDITDNELFDAEVKDTVKLKTFGMNVAGKEISYTIFRDGLLGDTEILTLTSSNGQITWKAGQKVDGTFETGNNNYYFKAKATDGSTNEVISETLSVTSPEDNSPPNAIILTPEYGSAYLKTKPVSFTQASYDSDDSITTLWDFGDGTTSQEYNVNHVYNTDGQKIITLKVTDSRGLVDIDETSILVCGGSAGNSRCLFADIFYPPARNLEPIAITGNTVKFNASSSYALYFNPVNSNLSCLGGLCPGFTGDGGIIYGSPNWTGFSQFEFNWTFLEQGDANRKTTYNAKGFAGVFHTKKFNSPALTENPHKASVIVVIPDLSSNSETKFTMSFSLPMCDWSANPVGWWYSDADGNQYFMDWTNANYNCYRDTAVDGMNSCCPRDVDGVSYACDTSDGKCKEVNPSIICESFTQEECSSNNNNPDVASNELEGIAVCGYENQKGDLCYERTNCMCLWDETTSECIAASNTTIEHDDGIIYSSPLPSNIDTLCANSAPTEIAGICEYPSIEYTDSCNTTGRMLVTWTASWTGTDVQPESCIGGERETECISGAVLGFFSWLNFIIVIIILAIFYLIVISRKHKHKVKEKIKNKNIKKRK